MTDPENQPGQDDDATATRALLHGTPKGQLPDEATDNEILRAIHAELRSHSTDLYMIKAMLFTWAFVLIVGLAWFWWWLAQNASGCTPGTIC